MLNKMAQQTKSKLWRYSLVFFGVLLLVFVTVSTLFGLLFLNSVETSLDLRQQAQVAVATIQIDSYPFSDSFFRVGDNEHINLQINTQNQDISQIDLEFVLVTSPGLFDTDPTITANQEQGLSLTQQQVESVACQDQCWSVKLSLEPSDSQQLFNSHDLLETVASLNFSTQQEGDFYLQLTANSQVLDSASHNIFDVTTAPNFQYYVSDNGIDPAQCYYLYSGWSDCQNFWQSRTYQVEPANCQWYDQENLEELSRQCQMTDDWGGILAQATDFYLYTFLNCFNYPNNGTDLYVLWNADQYQDVSWVDVSYDANFSSFYHKSTRDAYEQDDYMIMDASGFTGATSDIAGWQLSFQPDRNYYFRLYDDDAEQWITGARYYMNFCSADQSQYLNCDARCGEGTDNPEQACAEGLSCIEGRCRLADNPTNQWCLNTPAIGQANRSCDAYCANNADCASNLTCYWNHCRLPGNLSDDQCITSDTSSSSGSQLPSQVYDLTTYGCNHGCNTNRDCAADYRCYKGQCRLAINPTSQSCSSQELVDISLDRSSSDSTGFDLVDDVAYQETINDQEASPASTSGLTTNTPSWWAQILGSFNQLGQQLHQADGRLNIWWLIGAAGLVIVAVILIILGLKQKPITKPDNKEDKKTSSDQANQAPVSQLEVPKNKPTDL